MTFVESLGAYLTGFSGLSTLVGARVYPVRAPDQPVFPYVVYSVRITPENALSESPIDHAAIRVSAFARESATRSGYYQAHAIADQVRAALAFYRGTLATGGSVSQGSLVMSTEDSEAAEFGIFETVTEAEMWY